MLWMFLVMYNIHIYLFSLFTAMKNLNIFTNKFAYFIMNLRGTMISQKNSVALVREHLGIIYCLGIAVFKPVL